MQIFLPGLEPRTSKRQSAMVIGRPRKLLNGGKIFIVLKLQNTVLGISVFLYDTRVQLRDPIIII